MAASNEVLNSYVGQMVDLVAARVGQSSEVHPETAIASAARLAGSLMLRSFNLDFRGARPGTVVLSEEANEALPQLIGITSQALQSFGIEVDGAKVGTDNAQRGEAPTLSTVDCVALLQNDAIRMAGDSGMDLREASRALAIATAFLVKECAADIGAEVGLNVALFSLIEGCKTVPPAEGPTPQVVHEKKPWYQFW